MTDTRPARAVGGAIGRAASGALRAATTHPRRVLGIGLVIAAVGWGLDTQTRVESDVQKLVPQALPALRDLRALQESTGVGGEIDVVVDSQNLTDPATVAWMTRYQQRLLKRFGYRNANGCGKAELCPAFSLPDLFQGGGADTRASIESLLDAVPPYFSQGVLTADRHTATLAFGIRLMPLDEQQRVIEVMKRSLDPPAGVKAELAGLPVLAAEANAGSPRPGGARYSCSPACWRWRWSCCSRLRNPARALVPLVPIALATGWSALVLFLTRVPLNPMSVTLGALVIAISTEFSVLLGRALSPGARRGPRARRSAGAHVRLDRRARCWPPAPPRSRASPCWSCRTSACCATSASSRSST